MLASRRQILAVELNVYSLNHILTVLDCRFVPFNSAFKVICRNPIEAKRNKALLEGVFHSAKQ